MPCSKGRWNAGTTSSAKETMATTFTLSIGTCLDHVSGWCERFSERNVFSNRGAFHIYVASENEPSPRLVGQYEGSGSFGELALMYNMPRAATVQVSSSGRIIKFIASNMARVPFVTDSGYVARISVGHGPNYLPADHPEDGVQKAQDVRNAPGDGAHVTGLDGKTLRNPVILLRLHCEDSQLAKEEDAFKGSALEKIQFSLSRLYVK